MEEKTLKQLSERMHKMEDKTLKQLSRRFQLRRHRRQR